MRKIRVAVLFGGRSVEHEVSIQSARNIINALDKKKYEVIPIGIDKKGSWHRLGDIKLLSSGRDFHRSITANLTVSEPTQIADRKVVDVVFPILHGTYGEDGTVQGLLKLAGIPFVGAGVLGSAVGMDKDVQKRLLRDAGIPVAKFTTDLTLPSDFPVFVKPANSGSSVGISKVHNKKELKKAVAEAFKYDKKILIEEAIVGRELECSVLGNDRPKASAVGEVLPTHEFYDYDAKYIDENGAKLEIPAKLTKKQVAKVQKTAVQAYKTLCCEGMARADMFLEKSGRVVINEINTIPGFTNISMYPKLWEQAGLPVEKLLDKLIALALERFKKEKKLVFEK